MADSDEQELAAEGALLAIVLALDAMDPLTNGTAYMTEDVWCMLCEAEAPGGAQTMTPQQHAPSCPWRQAREYAEMLRTDVRRAAEDGR